MTKLQEQIMTEDEQDEQINKLAPYLANQTKQASSIARYMIYSMVGVIWLISYSNGQFKISDDILKISLFLCFVYMLLDLLHYFLDARFYHNEIQKIVSDKNMTVDRHIRRATEQSQKSYTVFVHKIFLAIVTALTFLIGIYKQIC